MILLRSIAIYSATLLWALIFWSVFLLPVLAAFLLPAAKRRHWMRTILLFFGLSTVRFAWRPFFGVSYEDRTEGFKGPGILVADHRSAIDAFLVSLPRRSAAQTVNGWPLKLPILGPVARSAGYLDITGWDHDTLRARIEEVFAAGDPIVSYPEGTRSESRKMNPFHSGIFRIAMELNVPVYMLCIAGNQFMPDRKFRFREFRDLAVRFLEPVPKEEVRECPTAYVLKKKVFRRMEEELAEMDEELEK